MTEEELNEFHDECQEIYATKLTPLGAERINKAREDENLPPSTQEVVPFGNDLLTYKPGIKASLGETRGEGPQSPTGGGMGPTGPTLPSYVDNSLLHSFPPIRSQGSLSSCVPFSIIYYQLTHEVGQREGWDNKNNDNTIKFSPKWGYNFINDGNNAYTNWGEAYEVVKKHGAVKWSEFPYDNDYRKWCLDTQAWRDAVNYRVESVNQFNMQSQSDLDLLKEILNNGHVAVFGSFIYSWVYQPVNDNPNTNDDDSFVGEAACYDLNGTSGSHSMTIVGYHDDIWVDVNGNGLVDSNELGALKIANSWGPGWKNSGFSWLTYDAAVNVSGAVRFVYSITLKDTEPKLLAEFTLNHAKRNQLHMSLGISDITKNNPDVTWIAEVLTGDGGPYAFDGTDVACDGTFVLDFTDIMDPLPGEKKYYLRMEDSDNDGVVAEVSEYKLHHLLTGEIVEYIGPLPQTADHDYVLLSIIYEPGDNIFPVAQISTSPDPPSGYVPFNVTFSGEGSYDPDGFIESYWWDFGDGTNTSGENVSHQYTSAGTYNVVLTVTDNGSAEGSDSCIVQVAAGPDPLPPRNQDAALVPGSLSDVRITWTASEDEGAGDNDIVGYTVYKSSTGINGLYENVSWIATMGTPDYSYEWIDSGEGDGDWNNYFYIVRAKDVLDIEEHNSVKVGKFASLLAEGWNMISVPLLPSDTSREIALKTIEGNYAAVQGYQAGMSGPWISWHRDKPSYFNDAIEVNHLNGYYIDMLVSDHLVTAGRVADQENITLKSGWNLVGYPCLSENAVTDALSSIAGNYDRVEKYDTARDREVGLLDRGLMVPGQGYWIHVNQDCVWTITN